MKLLVINPNTSQSMTDAIAKSARKYTRRDTEVTAVCATRGPRSIEGNLDHHLAAVGVLECIAQTNGKYDAYIIACFGDPAVEAAREMTTVPVIGIAEAAMHFSCFLGHKFSVLSVLDRARPTTEDLIRHYGLFEKCASIRTTGLAVLELEKDPTLAAKRLEEEGRKAITEDGAEALLLGCAGLTGFAQQLEEKLKTPVLDGVVCAVKLAEIFVECGFKTCKNAMFKAPEKKELVGYNHTFDYLYN